MGPTDRLRDLADKLDKLIKDDERHRAFLDASPWAILVVNDKFNIEYYNKTFSRMTGYEGGQLIGEHLRSVLPESDWLIHSKHEKQYLNNPVTRTGNHGLSPRLVTAWHKAIDVEVSISPTSIDGKRYFFASIRPIDTLFDTVQGYVKRV